MRLRPPRVRLPAAVTMNPWDYATHDLLEKEAVDRNQKEWGAAIEEMRRVAYEDPRGPDHDERWNAALSRSRECAKRADVLFDRLFSLNPNWIWVVAVVWGPLMILWVPLRLLLGDAGGWLWLALVALGCFPATSAAVRASVRCRAEAARAARRRRAS